MYLVLIIFRSSLEQDLLGVLERERVAAFTVLPEALGVGEAGRAWHAFPWPASNAVVLAALDAPAKERLVAALRAFRDAAANRQREAIPLRVFAVPCEQAI